MGAVSYGAQDKFEKNLKLGKIQSFFMMLQKIGIAQLNVFCTALCLTISALPDRQTDPHHSRSESSKNQLGTAQPQLVFFKSVWSNDHRQDYSESKGLVMGR